MRALEILSRKKPRKAPIPFSPVVESRQVSRKIAGLRLHDDGSEIDRLNIQQHDELLDLAAPQIEIVLLGFAALVADANALAAWRQARQLETAGRIGNRKPVHRGHGDHHAGERMAIECGACSAADGGGGIELRSEGSWKHARRHKQGGGVPRTERHGAPQRKDVPVIPPTGSRSPPGHTSPRLGALGPSMSTNPARARPTR